MSLLTDIIGLATTDKIEFEDVLALGKEVAALVQRIAAVAAAQGMTAEQWTAATGLEGARLDAWLAATNAAEDKALKDG